jgi:isopentenyl-diphosphate delta-isomerase
MAVRDRKSEHLRIAAEAGVEHDTGTGLAHVRLRHRALPERDLRDVQLETHVLGHTLAAPLLVSAMTGGTPEAAVINRRLLEAAAENGLALMLGSGRPLLEDPELLRTYRPDGAERPPLLLANLGASQLRGAAGAVRAERVVELLGADGLTVHLNPLQEAIQPEGQAAFDGVLAGIAAAVERLSPLPVVVKEVGFGLSGADVAALREAGVAAVDVAGAGGTNWALVEGIRDERAAGVAAAFADWGLGTVQAVREAVAAAPGVAVIASGGLRDGVDCAKCLALGAVLGGMARPLLLAARTDRVHDAVATLVHQLRIATWLTGAARSSDLGREHLA